jgi:hypothetical protein
MLRGYDERRGQIIVVDDDAGVLPGHAFAKVDVLTLVIAVVRRLGPISHPIVPHPLDPQEDRVVPVMPELGTVQEEPVEEEDRSGQRLLFRRVDGDVGVNVEDGPPESRGPASGSSSTRWSVA